MPPPPLLDCYAVTAPGVAPITARELEALGLGPGEAEPGGVPFRAPLAGLRAANLHLRTASRVLVRLGEFHASAFYQLEQRARKLPWAAFLRAGDTVAFRVTSRKSKLYHQRGIAERLAGAVLEAVPEVSVDTAKAAEDEADGAEPGAAAPGSRQLFVVRVLHDRCLVSADASGDLLHRRGYRQATAKAPLRETLAASLLLASGWDGTHPLLDPLCGSGTIPIEAALLARRIPPGLGRHFRFEGWPGHEARAWSREVDAARSLVLPRAPVAIAGSDRDAGAIAAARANAERAGVSGDVAFEQAPLSSATFPAGDIGWVVTNPPWGARVGEAGPLRDLYARFGALVRERGWHAAMVAADPGLVRHTGLPCTEVVTTNSGGIPVRMVRT